MVSGSCSQSSGSGPSKRGQRGPCLVEPAAFAEDPRLEPADRRGVRRRQERRRAEPSAASVSPDSVGDDGEDARRAAVGGVAPDPLQRGPQRGGVARARSRSPSSSASRPRRTAGGPSRSACARDGPAPGRRPRTRGPASASPSSSADDTRARWASGRSRAGSAPSPIEGDELVADRRPASPHRTGPDTDQNQRSRMPADSTASSSGSAIGAGLGEQVVRAGVVDVGQLAGQRHRQQRAVPVGESRLGQRRSTAAHHARVVQAPVVARPTGSRRRGRRGSPASAWRSPCASARRAASTSSRAALGVAGVAQAPMPSRRRSSRRSARREAGEQGRRRQRPCAAARRRRRRTARPRRPPRHAGRSRTPSAPCRRAVPPLAWWARSLDPRLEVVGPQRLEHVGDAGVMGGQAGGVQLGGERARHERVGEREPPGRAGRRPRRARRRAPAPAGRARRRRRGRARRRARRGRSVGRSPPRRSATPASRAAAATCAAGRRPARRGGPPARRRRTPPPRRPSDFEQREQLAEVERVAAGDVGEVSDERRVRVRRPVRAATQSATSSGASPVKREVHGIARCGPARRGSRARRRQLGGSGAPHADARGGCAGAPARDRGTPSSDSVASSAHCRSSITTSAGWLRACAADRARRVGSPGGRRRPPARAPAVGAWIAVVGQQRRRRRLATIGTARRRPTPGSGPNRRRNPVAAPRRAGRAATSTCRCPASPLTTMHPARGSEAIERAHDPAPPRRHGRSCSPSSTVATAAAGVERVRARPPAAPMPARASSWARIAASSRRSSGPGSTPMSSQQQAARPRRSTAGLDGPTGSVQRHGELRPQSLAVWLAGDLRGERGRQLGVLAEREANVGERLDRFAAPLLVVRRDLDKVERSSPTAPNGGPTYRSTRAGQERAGSDQVAGSVRASPSSTRVSNRCRSTLSGGTSRT